MKTKAQHWEEKIVGKQLYPETNNFRPDKIHYPKSEIDKAVETTKEITETVEHLTDAMTLGKESKENALLEIDEVENQEQKWGAIQ